MPSALADAWNTGGLGKGLSYYARAQRWDLECGGGQSLPRTSQQDPVRQGHPVLDMSPQARKDAALAPASLPPTPQPSPALTLWNEPSGTALN